MLTHIAPERCSPPGPSDLAGRRRPDISPDGEHFFVVKPVHDESAVPPAIVVVQNWWAEFEK